MTINNELVNQLKMEKDFLAYLKLLKKALPYYVIFITVNDTGASPSFTEEHAKALMDLGLKINMYNRIRWPYLAVIYKGQVAREMTTDRLDQPITESGTINQHSLFLYSAGFHCQTRIGMGSFVMFDGANFSMNRRGFNFLIFDIDNDNIIDSCVFDTFSLNKAHHRVVEATIPLLDYVKKHEGVQLCTITIPRPPQDCKHNTDLTPYERFLADKSEIFQQQFVAGDKLRMKYIYDNKVFPFCNDYETFDDFFEAFNEPQSFLDENGLRKHVTHHSHAVNTVDGFRITTDQPANPKRAIYFIGSSFFYGSGATDDQTFESQLQRKLNSLASDNGFIVYNRSFGSKVRERDILTLNSLPVKSGDIVFFYSRAIWGIPCCDLLLKSVRPHDYGEIFTDKHFTFAGNRLIADSVYDFLERHDFFTETLKEKSKISATIENYKEKLKSAYTMQLSQNIGAILTNCDPVTNGHLHLIDQALKQCDKLVVFVVNTEKSFLPIEDRLNLAKKNFRGGGEKKYPYTSNRTIYRFFKTQQRKFAV